MSERNEMIDDQDKPLNGVVIIKDDPLYKSKREQLEKTGQVQLGDLILYDYGRKGMIIHFD